MHVIRRVRSLLQEIEDENDKVTFSDELGAIQTPSTRERQLQEELSQTKVALSRLQSELDDLEQSHRSQEQTHQDVVQQLELHRKKSTKYAAKVDTLRKKVEEVQVNREQHRNLEIQFAILQETASHLRSTQNSLQQDLTRSNDIIHSLRNEQHTERQTYDTERLKFIQEFKTKEDRQKELEQEIKQLRDLLAAGEDKDICRIVQTQKLQAELEVIRTELERRIQAFEVERAQASQEARKTQEQQLQFEHQIEVLKHKLALDDEQQIRLINELETQRDEVDRLRVTLDQRKEASRAEQDNRHQQATQSAKVQQQLEHQLELMRHQLENARDLAASARDRLKQEIETNKKDTEAFRLELALRVETNEVERKAWHAQASQQAAEHRDQCLAYQRELHQLTCELERKQTEYTARQNVSGFKGRDQEQDLLSMCQEEFGNWCDIEGPPEGTKSAGLMDITLTTRTVSPVVIRIESKNYESTLPKREFDKFYDAVRRTQPEVAILFARGKIDNDMVFEQAPSEDHTIVFKVSHFSQSSLRRAIYNGVTQVEARRRLEQKERLLECETCAERSHYVSQLHDHFSSVLPQLHSFLAKAAGMKDCVGNIWRSMHSASQTVTFMTSSQRLAIAESKPSGVRRGSRIKNVSKRLLQEDPEPKRSRLEFVD